MKSLSPVFLLIALFLSCSEAPKIEAELTPRVVLAELFTFARCTYCPFSEHALDSLSEEYGDSLAVIAYHRRVLGDTLSPTYVAVRESLYQIDVSPTVVFDGVHVIQTEDPSQNYATYQNYIIQRRTVTPKLRLYLETIVISSSVNLKLHIVAIDSIEDGDYDLFFTVYEDSVFFAQSGAPESTFSYVMRKMIPDAYGAPISVTYPDSFIEEVDFNLEPTWDHEKIGVVAFIQDMETKEVLQAVVKKRVVVD